MFKIRHSNEISENMIKYKQYIIYDICLIDKINYNVNLLNMTILQKIYLLYKKFVK